MPEWESVYDIMGKGLIKLGKYSEAVTALKKGVRQKCYDLATNGSMYLRKVM